MTRAARRRGLSASTSLRLYESLGAVAEQVPDMQRPRLISMWRRIAWRLPDTDLHRLNRHRIRTILKDLDRWSLVKPDWEWILKVLPDDGAADLFWRWATDAGYVKAASKQKRVIS